MIPIRPFLLIGLLFIAGCQNQAPEENTDYHQSENIDFDPHSFARPGEARITHLDLDATVDFDRQVITGTASYDIKRSDDATKIILDTRNLDIREVRLDDGEEIEFSLAQEKEHLGQALHIPLKANTQQIHVDFSSRPDAAALLWLSPEQTADKEAPFMFSQGQAILTRTWLPIQDSPGIRFTYDAKLKVPEGMLALMSASNPQVLDANGEYTFTMEQPIPAYLMAIAAGKLTFESVGEQTGVYAEPSMIKAAAWEFGQMQEMLNAAEELYGPYLWERYDVLVLPPSFPFGGMENPRLTFVTPTIIAGDRSLTALIAHELAHSWSGNLVTNKNWNEFWLNEGFTVYFERRIMEALYGEDYVKMLSMLGYQDLERTLADLGSNSEDTRLKLSLENRDPDEGMTDIAYEKGALFLKKLELEAGRETFDAFLRNYFDEHKFETIDSETFVEYLKKELLEPNSLDIDVEAWIYEPGIPEGAPLPDSDRFEEVEAALNNALEDPATDLDTSGWTTHEWLHFIRHIPVDTPPSTLEALDNEYSFAWSSNSEIQAAWYEIAIKTGYESEIRPNIREFLREVGRRKFLVPLYRAYKETGQLELARDIYANSRQNYHTVSTGTIDALLGV